MLEGIGTMRALIAPVIALGLVWTVTFGAMTVVTAPIGHAGTLPAAVIPLPEASAGNDRYEERGLLRVSPGEPDSFAPVPSENRGLPLF